jgi:hypothetical protein
MAGLIPPKGNLVNMSRRKSKTSKAATPIETQHNHFSIDHPFTACIIVVPPGAWTDGCYSYVRHGGRAIRENGDIVAAKATVATGTMLGKFALFCPK